MRRSPRTCSRPVKPAGPSTHRACLRIESLEPRAVPAVSGLVFLDADADGIQDAGITAVAGVAVRLFQGDTLVGNTTTGTDGDYSFDEVLLPVTDYQVRIDTTQATLAGLTLAPANQGDDDRLDSDATLAGSTAVVSFTSGAEGQDVGFDVGFVTAAPTLTLGNLVFRDANDNGTRDTGETGVSGVTVELLNAAGDTVLATATTGASGAYTFTGLAAGTYRVRLAAGNFSGSGPLVGFTPSATSVADPNTNVDSDSNGTASGTLGEGGVIVSGPIALTADGEPTNDGDADANTNLTLDFGVVPPAVPATLTLGDTVFRDVNNNGTLDAGEAGIGGVLVELLDGTGATVLASTTTSGSGRYTFTALAAGDYLVRLAASNFAAAGALAGFSPSTAVTDPDNNADNDNNGSADGTLGSGGVIQSEAITLTDNGEPANDGDTDADTNLSLDFGVVPPAAATGSISGRVFLDYDNGGVFNGADTALQGVTVSLSGGDLSAPVTTTTDAQGNFTFTNLSAGTYTLTQTQPTSPANQTGHDTAGTAGGSAATANTITGIALTAGQVATGYAFAEVPLVSTGGAVFQDTNGNGLRDTGEPGIPGVTITLAGTSAVTGAITPRTTTTDAQGAYSFGNLTPGTYSLTETQPTGFTDGQEQNGTPAATVGNDTFTGIDLTATAATSGGFNFGEVATAAGDTDLAVGLAVSANRVPFGGTVVLTYTVRNQGADAASGVEARLSLGGLQYLAASSADFDPATRTWAVGDLAAGEARTLRVVARVVTMGAFAPSIRLTAPSSGDALLAADARAVRTVTSVLPPFWFLSSAWALPPVAATVTAPNRPPVANPATPTLALNAASDTGTAGDGATTLGAVTLVGTTSPGATVLLVQTGATATADESGSFSFTGVPLAAGANTLTARATNAEGGASSTSVTLTRDAAPTVLSAPDPVSLGAGASTTLDLAGVFDDADIANSLVRFDTSAGPINVELLDRQAPRTVANFLNYATGGDYTDSIFHRSARRAGGTPFVLQGGGFTFESSPAPSLAAVPTDPPVQNEPDAVNRSNVRGTLAMAKLGGNPNSATSQFFFNLSNNSSILDTQNGGFTVFGRVVGAADQAAVDALAAVPTQDQGSAAGLPGSQQGVFGEIPLPGYTGTNFPADTTRANYAIVNAVSIVRRTEELTYSVAGNSDPTVASATVTANRLTIQAARSGQTTVTVRATDRRGATVETTVTVTVA